MTLGPKLLHLIRYYFSLFSSIFILCCRKKITSEVTLELCEIIWFSFCGPFIWRLYTYYFCRFQLNKVVDEPRRTGVIAHGGSVPIESKYELLILSKFFYLTAKGSCIFLCFGNISLLPCILYFAALWLYRAFLIVLILL